MLLQTQLTQLLSLLVALSSLKEKGVFVNTFIYFGNQSAIHPQ